VTEARLDGIGEIAPGAFGVRLAPCSCQRLAQLLLPVPGSVVWLVAFHPIATAAWTELALPLSAEGDPERVRARLPRYDLQFPLDDFLARLPRLQARAGMLAVQLARAVPDTLLMEHLVDDPQRHAVLQRHGWLLSFDLPHDGAPAWVESPDRAHLARIVGG